MDGVDMLSDDFMPVFLINGFLEAGKTRFIQFTLEQDYFQTDGKTLLILCEEGDTEYNEEILKKTRTSVVCMDSIGEMTLQRLEELEIRYNPERILVEWNGMWNQDQLCLPADWAVFQQITVIDASTLGLYLKNMKPQLASQLRNSELIICNRCDEIEDLASYKRILKAMNQRAEIIFEDSEGEIDEIAEEDLPFDMAAEVIEIPAEAYGIWYIDCLDKKERYEGKTVEFTAMVLKPKEFERDFFVPGRVSMTCCEADMTFLGFLCRSKEADRLKTKQWVRVRAKIAYEYCKEYGGEGPVLHADFVRKADSIKSVVQF